MPSLQDAEKLIANIVSTQGWVGIRNGGVEIHIHGGISGQKFREIEKAAWQQGLILDRIYYHRNSDALAIRFKKPED